MEITVLNNQSILDISIQHTGTVENSFSIAVANGFSVSDLLISGTTLILPDGLQKNNDVLNYYTAKQIQPASGITTEQNNQIPILKGIGYMQINNSFKVSKNE
jgi:hypothetical protein